ncbi:hypothetical protein FGG08_004230 [Glutinoglossum americanum]|uniref:Sensitive to high expression protein 9, mitochondrial n=1 Tax=Glutinoglossum americanum TaxID=1670608 RepID=A0A9P8I9M7_9PEZI|nr:hypothetical protein FGG08_004230 [Glutinoglossum americanum]
MPPLLAPLSRQAIEPIAVRIVRFSGKASANSFASTCLQCQWGSKLRQYSDKHPNSHPLRAHGLRRCESFRAYKYISSSRSLSLWSDPPPPSSSSTTSAASTEPGNDKHTAQFKGQDLPSQKEDRRSQISKRFSRIMDNLQSNIFLAGQRLNDLTGYSGIEALKRDITEQEIFVRSSRHAVRKAKDDYSSAISQRSASQREVNELLQRKHAWSAADLERFTSLYRSDHANEQSETAAQNALIEAERVADEAAARLGKSILARYHEEQIWSDKIRRMSTWGTWGLMGVNVLLFLVFQIGVEPWRRKRLVKGFEEKVKEALGNQDAGLVAAVEVGAGPQSATVMEQPVGRYMAVSPEMPIGNPGPPAIEESVILEVNSSHSLDPSHATPSPQLSNFEAYKAAFQDLFSERQVSVRKLDVTIIALEGVATGAALVGLIVALLRWR